jgi:hypothetical protein
MHRERELRRAQAKMKDLAAHLDSLTASVAAPLATRATSGAAPPPPPSVQGGMTGSSQGRQVAVSAPGAASTSSSNPAAGMQTPVQGPGTSMQQEGGMAHGYHSGLRPGLTAPSASGIGRGRMAPLASGTTSLPGGHTSLSSLRGRGATATAPAPTPSVSSGPGAGAEQAAMLRGARHLYRGYLAGLESDTTVDSDVGY